MWGAGGKSDDVSFGGFAVNSHYRKVVSFWWLCPLHALIRTDTHSLLSPPSPKVTSLSADSKDSLKEGRQNMKTFHVQHAKRLNWCITSQVYQARGILWLWRKCILLLLKCVCVCARTRACMHTHTHTHVHMQLCMRTCFCTCLWMHPTHIHTLH